MQTKLKKKSPINWGTDKCSIKTIYIKDYFKVEGASYTDDLCTGAHKMGNKWMPCATHEAHENSHDKKAKDHDHNHHHHH